MTDMIGGKQMQHKYYHPFSVGVFSIGAQPSLVGSHRHNGWRCGNSADRVISIRRAGVLVWAVMAVAVVSGWEGGTTLAEQPKTGSWGPSITGYRTIQEAIDAHPGKIIYVPPGDYKISEKLRFHTDN